jgi:hypothetical protein
MPIPPELTNHNTVLVVSQCHGTNFNLQDGGSRVDENFLSVDEAFDLLGRAGRVAASRGIDKTAGHDFRARLKIKLKPF